MTFRVQLLTRTQSKRQESHQKITYNVRQKIDKVAQSKMNYLGK